MFSVWGNSTLAKMKRKYLLIKKVSLDVGSVYAAATDMSADALIILTKKYASYKYGREWPMYTDIALTSDKRLGGG